MLHILGLDLKNVVTFKELSVDFDNNLTYVRGLNLDSDPANPTSNGAGKSLLFSAIANLRYQSVPTSTRKKSKKDILGHKGSTVGLILRPYDDGPEYEIIQSATKYSIYENGKDLQIRTVPLAEEFIRKLFPMPEITFYSTCYLSTQRPYLLQKDTDSNRLQHITEIFNLDQYSGIRDILSVKARTIKDNEVKLSVLEQRLAGLTKKLSEVSCSVTPLDYEKATGVYDNCTKRINALQNKKFELISVQRALDSLLKIETSLDRLRKQYPYKQPPAEVRKQLKGFLINARAWSDWESTVRQAKKMRADISKKLAALDIPEQSQSKCEKLLAKSSALLEIIEASIAEMRIAKKEHDRITTRLREVVAEISELGIEREDIPELDFESEISVLRSTLRLEKLLHKHDSDFECPTCMSKLEVADLKRTLKAAKKKLPELEAFACANELMAEADELTTHAPLFDIAAFEKLQQRAKNLQERIAQLEDSLATHRKAESLQSTLDSIEIPKEPSAERPKDDEERITFFIELCTSILDGLSSKAVALENHPEFADLRSVRQVAVAISEHERLVAELDAQLDNIRTKQSNAAAKVSSYQHFENTVLVYRKERNETAAEIELLKPGMSDKKILDILLKAYGPKGLRAKAAESVCKLLETNLNHYRDLIFAEPFIFEVNASDTGISILVDRNNGKADSVSDVRHLSGAESNSFQLLSMISLLPLQPTQNRINLAILDEPTAHMCSISSALFNERFLPVLREVVPNVYVITPHSYDSGPNSAEWVVQKHLGTSILKV